MLLRQGVEVALPNTQKQTQGGCQIVEMKKYDPNERTEQNSRKRTKQSGDTNLSDAEFKTLVIRMLKELIEYGTSIKKTQAEMKVALSEIKKNLQGINSGVDEAQNQINMLEHKEGKKNIQEEQQEEKRILKNEDSVRSLWDISKQINSNDRAA